MEIVLLWLDDLDDLLCTAVVFWERVRRACLKVGLLTAVLLPGSAHFESAAILMPWFAIVSGVCVAIWVLGFSTFLLMGPRRTLQPIPKT